MSEFFYSIHIIVFYLFFFNFIRVSWFYLLWVSLFILTYWNYFYYHYHLTNFLIKLLLIWFFIVG